MRNRNIHIIVALTIAAPSLPSSVDDNRWERFKDDGGRGSDGDDKKKLPGCLGAPCGRVVAGRALIHEVLRRRCAPRVGQR